MENTLVRILEKLEPNNWFVSDFENFIFSFIYNTPAKNLKIAKQYGQKVYRKVLNILENYELGIDYTTGILKPLDYILNNDYKQRLYEIYNEIKEERNGSN